MSSLFDETSILLPGSLEEQNRPFDFTQDGENMPLVDHDIGKDFKVFLSS